MTKNDDHVTLSRDALRARLSATLAPQLVDEVMLDVAGPEPKIKRGKGPDYVHSEKTIRRVLATYVPPATVAIVMTALGATLQEMGPVPEPTEEQRAFARRRLQELGVKPRR
ncbi:MAG: hypothetical protein H6725_12540 [Sandaracinaceae bacterium]|nr:hypothetical protein [Sandaracinaceae bacterium]